MKYMHELSFYAITNKIPIVITNMIRNMDGKEVENSLNTDARSISKFIFLKIHQYLMEKFIHLSIKNHFLMKLQHWDYLMRISNFSL